ncbi:hypothetical protein XarbCFBP8150_21705, partial [Xanthomonas arboricola]|uniref:hypothetical protein n=1 Tax=Xanthomonas arboricola TaxID=56448 RepID=UPI000D446BFD
EPYERYLLKLLRDNPDPAEAAAEHLRRNELPAIGALAHKLRGADARLRPRPGRGCRAAV